MYYAGQPVAVVADTLERAKYAATLVRVSIAAEQPVASYLDPKAQLYVPATVQDDLIDGVTILRY